MTHSETEIKDLVLSDRLRELGLDYVADVLEGKRKPSASQLMFMRTGHAFPLRQRKGTLLIGGARDGERMQGDPEKQRYITVPVPMFRPTFMPVDSYPSFNRFDTQEYRRERLRGVEREFPFYLIRDMEVDDGLQSLFDNYRSPNSVENHHGQS